MPFFTEIKPAEVTIPPDKKDECWKVPGSTRGCGDVYDIGVERRTFDTNEQVDYMEEIISL